MKITTLSPRLRRSAGFSLPEVIAAVAVVGVLSGVGYGVATHVTSAKDNAILEAQVRQINSDVRIYLAAGGSISATDTADDVIDKLKTEATNAKRIPFVSGSFIDGRLRAETGPAKFREKRAVWNTSTLRFDIVSGEPGIRAFLLDGTPPTPSATETRANAYNYAAADGWVWDFNDGAAVSQVSPVEIEAESTTLPPLAPTSNADPVRLTDPLFSPAPGTYNIAAIASGITITNPNTAGSSDIFYTTDGGTTWKRYTSAISVARGLVSFSAFSASLDSEEWLDSSLVGGNFTIVKTPTVSLTSHATVEEDTSPVLP